MQELKTGIILFTEKYEECINFYRDVIELPISYIKQDLTCFVFGGSYLLVETGGISGNKKYNVDRNPIVLRLDVTNFDESVENLRKKNIEIIVKHFEWGTIASFYDPEGNLCEIKKIA